MRRTVFISLAAIIGSCIYLFGMIAKEEKALKEQIIEVDTLQIDAPEPTLLYGFGIDSFDVYAGTIKRHQNLSEILLNYNISMGQIDQVARKSKDVFDVRKLKSNRPYTLICNRDSAKTARQFIYEPNELEYVVYNLVDSIYISVNEKEIKLRERIVSGVITSSLYESLEGTGFGPIITNSLVDVFAWQVDFFRITKGDNFKVILEEQVVDDVVVGIDGIKAAYFEHDETPYYAIHFDQGSGIDYFDEQGNSLRREFLKAPLNFTRISSRYNPRRFHPVLKTYRAHLGTDYAAPTGTPIRTVGDGVVTEATYKRNNGNYVKIRHNGNYSTQYLHMSKIASGIRPGVKVEQGQTIGFVGSTGLATGAHLCFRFWKNGRQVDALKVELPPSEPIRDEFAPEYYKLRDEMIARLDRIQIQQTTAKEITTD
ncbi:MAG: peptidoglycan DD-metalloendopeptidase family protein [Cyclobacteriaceae bacterium]